ncbi:hypothetical protein AN958_09558 [Leucoagaricus sp. SymC.cos]|nr:hypothetical protein AN958_09558 [Leucoagaricus sp. SymC.cos]
MSASTSLAASVTSSAHLPSNTFPAPPNVQLSYGPMLVGVFVNMILYGVLVAQTYTYYQIYKNDARWIKCLVNPFPTVNMVSRAQLTQVLYLFIVETANTGIDIAMMYQPLILQYGHPLVNFPVMFAAEPITIRVWPKVAISTPIQLFFAWRIRLLTKQNVVAAIIALLSLVSLAGGLWTTILITIIKLFKRKPELHWPALMWFLSATIADVLITITLVINLSRRKTGFAATDDAISKIIRMTVQTGMLTALFAIGDVIFFMTLAKTALNFIWDLALTKLYTNCLLSTLNARASLKEMTSAQSGQRQISTGGGNSRRPNHYLDQPVTPIHVQSSVFEMERKSYDRSYERSSRSNHDDVEYGITVTKVVYLLAAETVNAGFSIGLLYEPLILKYGQPAATTFFPIQPVMTVVISTPIQCFIAWRIKIISGRWWISAVIVVLSFISSAGGFWLAQTVVHVQRFARKPDLHWPALTWLLASAIADVIITISLVYSLAKRRTGFVQTDDTINKIIRTTVQTGLITAIFAVLDVICFLTLPVRNLIFAFALLANLRQHCEILFSPPSPMVIMIEDSTSCLISDRNFVWDLALSKLYTNALMSTLNARQSLGRMISGGNGAGQQAPTNVLFTDSSYSFGRGSDGSGGKLSGVSGQNDEIFFRCCLFLLLSSSITFPIITSPLFLRAPRCFSALVFIDFFIRSSLRSRVKS